MKRIWIALFLTALLITTAFAGSWTAGNIFYKPDVDESGYGASANTGFDNADARIRYLKFDDALYNSFFGNGTGNAITSGNYNLFLGYHAGILNTTGNYNIFMGANAGSTNTVGAYNTYIGANSGLVATASNNLFIGYNTGYSNTTGYENVFLGSAAGQGNIGGHGNFFAGVNAGYGNTTGNYNTFLGEYAGYGSNGNGNVGIGINTCRSLGSASTFTVCIGDSSGYKITTGTGNTFIGGSAGYETLNATQNTFIGRAAGGGAAAGNYNTAIGAYAGNRWTGTGNIGIGQFAGYYGSGDYRFYVNAFPHYSFSDEQTLSLLYGQMDASPTNQFLTVNGNLNINALGNPALNVVMNAGLETAKFTNISSQGSSNGPGLFLLQDDGSAMASGNRLGYFTFGGAYNSSHSYTDTTGISAYATENWSGTNKGSRIAFKGTPTGSAAQAEWATLLDGKLGMGTTAPFYKLDAVTLAGANSIVSRAYSTSPTQAGNFIGFKSHSATEALVTTVDGDYLGQYAGQGVNYAGSPAWNFGGIITFLQNGNQTAGDTYIPTDIVFKNTPGGATVLTERMRIDKNGNVGIGLSTFPIMNLAGRTYLSIQGPSQGGGMELSTLQADANSNPVGLISFADAYSTASSANRRVAGIGGYLDGTTATLRGGAIRFFTKLDGGDTALVERMRIDNTGNVGIGTSAPVYKLDIASINTGQNIVLSRSYSATSSNVYQPIVGVLKSHSNSEALATTVDTEFLGQFSIFGVNSAGSPAISTAVAIRGLQNGTQTGGDTAVPGDMLFMTAPGGTTGLLERMRIDKNGTLLLGTTTPLSPAIKMQTVTLGTNPGQTINIDYSTTTTDRAYYILAKSHSATEAMGTTVDQDYLGQINFTGVNYAGSPTLATAAAIRGYQNGTQTNGDTAVPADMAFLTSPGGSTSITERMRIDKNGNVGVGTALPSQRLDTITLGAINTVASRSYSTTLNHAGQFYVYKSHSATETLATTLDTERLGIYGFAGVNSAGSPAIAQGADIVAVQNGTQTGGDTTVPTDMFFRTSPGGSTAVQERLRLDKNGQIIIAAGGYLKVPVGSNVTSAATIAPTGMIFHVTGTTGVSLITIPFTGWTGSVTIIPDGIFTTATSGTQSGLNYPIALATTTVVSKALIMTFDGTKWYPSY